MNRLLSFLCVCALALASCTSSQQASTAGQQESAEDDDLKPWAKATEDTREVDGYFTFHQKQDDRTLLWEVQPEQVGADFGLMMHYSRGVGDFNVHDGLYLSRTRLMRFRRVGQTLHLVHRNPRFTADEGSALAGALKENVGHSIVGSFEIQSRHDSTGALLVDATDFFVSDYARVSDRLKPYFSKKPVKLRKEQSYVAEAMGFPENNEIDALLSYQPSGDPSRGTAGVSDARSIPVGVRYSLFALPEDPATPRPADDRVGFFTTSKFDFSKDRQPEDFESYVNRWRLEKKNPEAALSEPVEPIVYYLDRSIPPEYRAEVRAGVEAWRKAFRAAGFKNAIEARLAPEDDSTWSAEDVRYSTIRWTPSYQMGYAIGPSQADPRTGELLNADILISARWPGFWMRDWDFLADDVGQMIARDEQHRRLHERLPSALAQRLCTAARGRAQQMAFGYTALLARGALAGASGPPSAMPDAYLDLAIRDLVMHEVGHTLGLRHNFKASSAIPTDRLHDKAFTREHGVSLSVMDYTPVNVALPGQKQGYYWNPEVGSYDVWAIRYGYAPRGEQPGGEAPLPARERALDAVAEQSADPMHVYGTDGDRAASADPLTTARDLGDGMLEWGQMRSTLVGQIQPVLADRLIGEGQPWHRVRQALPSLLYERYGSLRPALKTVGGLMVARNHRGDPGAQPPLTPVPAERQRAAVQTIIDEALAPGAFSFEADLLNRLAPDFSPNWGNGYGVEPSYPLHEQVATLQGALVRGLLAPERLARVIDNAARMPEAPYRTGELFQTLTEAVWSELQRGENIGSFRRNLQRAHLEHLQALLLQDDIDGEAVPPDARSLARYELSRLSGLIAEQSSNLTTDRATSAHLAEAKAHIERALGASLTETVNE